MLKKNKKTSHCAYKIRYHMPFSIKYKENCFRISIALIYQIHMQ